MKSERSGPFRVAIIGAGPAGLFAAEELVLNADVAVNVDLFDRLPVPYGLVRYGVAPDHPNIKSVVSALQTVLEHPNVRFLGGIEFGSTIGRSELRRCYDAIIYATGAPKDRSLGIPGEDLAGSISATEMVAWYNGHPDATEQLDFNAKTAIVLGAGNVALDVCRILTREYEGLAQTDMPQGVLRRLRRRGLRDVHLIARRAPEFVKFSSKELRELGALASVNRIVNLNDIVVSEDAVLTRAAASNLQIFRRWSEEPTDRSLAASIHLRFSLRPIEIVGNDHVEAVVFERTAIDQHGNIGGTGELVEIPTQLVIRAVGYRGIALPEVPFDEVKGIIPNDAGRVVDNGKRTIVQGEYVTGWLKRGPSGVIGTNKLDSRETVAAVKADLVANTAGRRESIDQVLESKGAQWSEYSGWKSIDAAELARGAAEGRTRSKIHDWPTLLELAGQSRKVGRGS